MELPTRLNKAELRESDGDQKCKTAWWHGREGSSSVCRQNCQTEDDWMLCKYTQNDKRKTLREIWSWNRHVQQVSQYSCRKGVFRKAAKTGVRRQRVLGMGRFVSSGESSDFSYKDD